MYVSFKYVACGVNVAYVYTTRRLKKTAKIVFRCLQRSFVLNTRKQRTEENEPGLLLLYSAVATHMQESTIKKEGDEEERGGSNSLILRTQAAAGPNTRGRLQD